MIHELRNCKGWYLWEKKRKKAECERLKQQEASYTMVLRSLGCYNTDGVMVVEQLTMNRIRRRLIMTGLIVEASLKAHATFDMLMLPEVGVRHDRWENIMRKAASWSTRATSLISEEMMCPCGLVNLPTSAAMLSNHFMHQKK